MLEAVISRCTMYIAEGTRDASRTASSRRRSTVMSCPVSVSAVRGMMTSSGPLLWLDFELEIATQGSSRLLRPIISTHTDLHHLG